LQIIVKLYIRPYPGVPRAHLLIETTTERQAISH